MYHRANATTAPIHIRDAARKQARARTCDVIRNGNENQLKVPLSGYWNVRSGKMWQRNGYREIRITLHPSVSRLPGLFPRTLFTLPSFFSLLSPSSSPSLHFSLSIYLSDRPSLSHARKYRNSDSFFLRSARVPAISPRPRNTVFTYARCTNHVRDQET